MSYGLISPMNGISPDDINLKSLIRHGCEVSEVIVATNATAVDGEATSMYISRPAGIKVTRLARGPTAVRRISNMCR